MTDLLLGKVKVGEGFENIYITPFHTVLAGQTNLSGKTTTVIALAGEAVKQGYTVLLFDAKPTVRDYEGFHDIPVCYQPTTDPLVLIGLLEAKRKAKLSNLYSTLGRSTERATTLKDIISNLTKIEATSKSGFIKDAAYTLRDLLRRVDDELNTIKFSTQLELKDGVINVMPINQLSNEAQQLVLKTAFEQALKNHNRKTILVIEEAFRFIPQGYSSACKRLVQDVITVGAKTELFVWISTQFLAPTEKDPLKACPNKILGRQDHDTEIDDTIALVPDGKAIIKKKDLMTLQQGEFYYVPLHGEVQKVLVTPPWQREQPPAKNTDKIIEEMRDEIKGLKAELQQVRQQPQQSTGATANGPVTVDLSHSETIYKIHHADPVVLPPLKTTTNKGRIMYALVHDRKGEPSSMQDIFNEMQEYGWPTNSNSWGPDTGGLVRDGYLIREGRNNIRPTTRVKLEIVKE